MNESVNILSLITDASLLVQLVMLALVLLSVVSWLVIFRLSMRLGTAKKNDEYFESWFWSGDSLNNLYQNLQKNDPVGLEQVFVMGYDEFGRVQRVSAKKSDISEAIERKFRVALGKEQARLEQGLPLLASIASVSPYIGLFGTVWGIMNAFIGLADADSVNTSNCHPWYCRSFDCHRHRSFCRHSCHPCL